MRMSAASASDSPAPTATPLMPATTGLSVSKRNASRNRPTHPFSSSTCSCSDSPVSTVSPSPPARSRPEQSEEYTSELQSLTNLVCRLLLEKKKKRNSSKNQEKNKKKKRIKHKNIDKS